MRTTPLILALCASIALAATPALAGTTADSQSGANSTSGAQAIGQGGGSSLVQDQTSSGASSTSGATASSGGNSTSAVNVIFQSNGGGGRGWRGRNGRGSAGDPSGASGSSSGTNGANGAAGADPTGPAGANGTNGTSGTSSAGGDPAYSITQSDHYSGGYTLRNTPEIVPPSVVGGNTCAVGVSGGLALPGFGIAGGATWAAKGCERRQLAALMFNMGHDAASPEMRAMLESASVQVLCRNEDVRAAFARIGHPCLEDQRVAGAAPAAEPVAQRAVVRAVPAPTVMAAVVLPKRKPAQWCSPATISKAHLATLDEGQRYYIKEQCALD